jgi:hypothetical protein
LRSRIKSTISFGLFSHAMSIRKLKCGIKQLRNEEGLAMLGSQLQLRHLITRVLHITRPSFGVVFRHRCQVSQPESCCRRSEKVPHSSLFFFWPNKLGARGGLLGMIRLLHASIMAAIAEVNKKIGEKPAPSSCRASLAIPT